MRLSTFDSISSIIGTTGEWSINGATPSYWVINGHSDRLSVAIADPPLPFACIISNLHFVLKAAPLGAGKNLTVSVTKNGAATALSIVIGATGQVFTDSVHTVQFAKGDTIGLLTTSTALGAVTPASWSVQIRKI